MSSRFDKDKQEYLEKLYKPDKSKKGEVDEQIIPLIDEINKKEQYYTTSSCAGRTVLISQPISGKKNESHWYYVNHEPSKAKDIIQAIKTIKKDIVWFKTEGVIIHICARDVESAMEFVKLCKLAGFKRSGIFSMTQKRIIVEALTPEHINVPIYDNGQLVTDDYIDYLTKEGNKKLKQARKRAEKLRELIKIRIKQ